MNNRNLFLTALGTGKCKVKAQQIRCPVRAHFWVTDGLLTVSSHGDGGGQLSGDRFIRTPVPLVRALPS